MESHSSDLDLDDWTEDDFAAAADLGELVREENRQEVVAYIKDILDDEEGCCG